MLRLPCQLSFCQVLQQEALERDKKAGGASKGYPLCFLVPVNETRAATGDWLNPCILRCTTIASLHPLMGTSSRWDVSPCYLDITLFHPFTCDLWSTKALNKSHFLLRVPNTSVLEPFSPWVPVTPQLPFASPGLQAVPASANINHLVSSAFPLLTFRFLSLCESSLVFFNTYYLDCIMYPFIVKKQ